MNKDDETLRGIMCACLVLIVAGMIWELLV